MSESEIQIYIRCISNDTWKYIKQEFGERDDWPVQIDDVGKFIKSHDKYVVQQKYKDKLSDHKPFCFGIKYHDGNKVLGNGANDDHFIIVMTTDC